MAGSGLSGMKFLSLIEIAALGSDPLNKSYKWHVSPVSWNIPTHPQPPRPRVLATPVQPLGADVSVCVALCIALSAELNVKSEPVWCSL